MMDALIALGSVIMEKDCRKEGRNLDHMGLKGLDLQQIKTYLNEGEKRISNDERRMSNVE
jgi:hypothetical protein